MFRGPSSLRTRLAVLFTAGSAVVLLGAAAFLFVVMDHALLAEVDDGLRARATDLEAIVNQSGGEIPDQDPFAQVIAADGTLIDSSPHDSTSSPALPEDQLQVDRRGTFVVTNVAALGGPSRLLIKPIDLPSGRVTLVVGQPLEQYVRTRERLSVSLLIGGPLLVLVIASAGWVLAGAALKPVRRMAVEADTIAVTDLDRRLEVPPGNDEIAQLGTTFNRLLDRVERAVAHERRFIDDASHELRSPLTILRGELELALVEPIDPDEMQQSVRSALDEAERLTRLANDLLVLARARAGELDVHLVDVDVGAHADRVVEQLAPAAQATIVRDGPGGHTLGDPDRLDQVLVNLVTNAARHAASQVRVTVGPPEPPTVATDAPLTTVAEDLAAGPAAIEIVVTDDGPGFAPSMLPVTFERFVRADPARGRSTGGAGLGLAIVADLVRDLGGTIEAGNGGALGGAWVRVRLPSTSTLVRA